MKKIKSLLALLLLGGMVLSGCGDKDKGGNPSDSGTPSQQGGSGDQGGSGNGDSSGGGNQGGGDQGGGGNQGGGETIVASWPSTTVQMYLDLLGVEHDRVPSIQNDAITSYAITSDATAVQTEQGFTIACVGGGSLLNSYIDTLLANGYTYRENVGCYMTLLGEVCIGLDVIEGNLVIIVMLPNAGGGGGGGGSSIPDGSRFLDTKIKTTAVSTNPHDSTTEQMLSNSYISFFDDATCELVIEVASEPYYVMFGTYGVNEQDNLATLHIYKLFDGEDEEYSWSVDQELQTLTVSYLSGSDSFESVIQFSGQLSLNVTATFTMNALPNSPLNADIPDDPNGNSFDNHYQVEQYRYNQFFKAKTFNPNDKFTVNARVPAGAPGEYEEYVVEVERYYVHISYPQSPNSDEYFDIINVNYNAQYEVESFEVIGYSRPYGEWQVSSATLYKCDFLKMFCGFVPVGFLGTTFWGGEGANYYGDSQAEFLEYSLVAEPYVHQITQFKAYFENNYPKKVSYKENGQDYTYNYSKFGDTDIELPEVEGGVPQPVSWPSSTVSQYLAKIGVTDSIPAATNGNITGYVFSPENINNVSDYFTIVCSGGSTLAATYPNTLLSNSYTYDSGEGYYISPNNQITITLNASGGDYFINVELFDNTPQLDYPCFYYYDGGWDYIELVQDPGNEDQYYLPNVNINSYTDFALGIAEDDWRYFENLNTAYSGAVSLVAEGNEVPNTSNHYFNVTHSAYYDIYVKKDSSAESGLNVYINYDIDAGYPSSSIAADLAGTSDPCIDFTAFGADEYVYSPMDIEGDVLVGGLFIEFMDDDSSAEAKDSFINDLLTLNYHWKYEGSTFDENVLVSENQEILVYIFRNFEFMEVEIVNLTLPECAGFWFQANYDFICDNVGWDADGAEFYAWIWGETNPGTWTYLTPSTDEFGNPYLSLLFLPEDITGLKIVRVNPNAANKPEIDSPNYGSYTDEEVWNETNNILLPGYNCAIHFGFNNW